MDANIPRVEKLGFFLLNLTTNQAHVGALLITDNQGTPLEFKCTEAIRPTDIQKSLYGKVIISHIGIKLCCVPLLKAAVNKPELLFVNDPVLLEIRKEIQTPILFVERTGDIENEPTIIVQPHSSFLEDKNDSDMRSLQFSDLIEPFDRIKTAVSLLGKKDERFQ